MVEGEEPVRALTRAALQSLGYTVLEARGGAEALRISSSHPGPIDLLVTDVVPGMNGRQVTEAVIRGRPRLRISYVSGYTDDAVVRRGVLSAATAFLQKPSSLAALAQKVREVLCASSDTVRDGVTAEVRADIHRLTTNGAGGSRC